jgi:hypothetical protein
VVVLNEGETVSDVATVVVNVLIDENSGVVRGDSPVSTTATSQYATKSISDVITHQQ